MGIGRWGACIVGACVVLLFGGSAAAEASPPSRSALGAELPELRTATSRTYRAEDGTFVTRIRASATPVSFNPSRALLASPSSSGDQFCWIMSGSGADDSHCNERTIQVGWDGTNTRRALLWFDLSGVPQQHDVWSAELWMYGTATGDSQRLAVHALSRAWGGTTGPTWNEAEALTPWGVAGGDFASEPAAVANARTGSNIWTVTGLVQRWLDASVPNNGMLIKQQYEPRASVVAFETADYPTDPHGLWLDVRSLPRAGEQKRYTFERQQIAPDRELAVNVANGNLMLREKDVEFFDTDQDYALERTYNSVRYRWARSFGTEMSLNTTGDVLLTGPSGEQAAFLPDGAGRYKSVGEYDQALTRAPNGVYTLTDPESRRQLEYVPNQYGSSGILAAQVDARGSRLALVYDQRPYPYGGVVSVEDELGRVTTLENDRYLVTSITDPDGGVHRFAYGNGSDRLSCDDGYLERHTDPAGGVTTYTYDLSNQCLVLLTGVTWPDGQQVQISYNVPGYYGVTVREVTLVTDATTGRGETTSYVYGDGYTTSTDPSGRQTTYWYDGSSRVTRTASGSQPPDLTLADDLWAARGTTLSAGEHTLTFNGTDSAGVAAFGVDVDDQVELELPSDCTSGCPTTATGAWTLDTADWEKGSHTITVTATDSDGNTTTRAFPVIVPEPQPFPDGAIPGDDLPTPEQEAPITTGDCESYYGSGSRYCVDPAPPQTQANALTDGVAPLSRSTRELVYGISEDGDTDYPSYPAFRDLAVRRVRRIVPYNLLEQESAGGPRKFPEKIAEFRRFYERAVDAGTDIMVSFQFRLRKVRDSRGDYIHNCPWEPAESKVRVIDYESNGTDRARDDKDCDGIVPDSTGPHSNFNYVPPQQNYVANVRAFKRTFPRVRTFSAWNEPNFKWQPTRAAKAGPRRAALNTFLLAKYVCAPGNVCQVVASDAAGGTGTSWRNYLAAYTAHLQALFADPRARGVPFPAIWGFHPYGDVERQTDPKKSSTGQFIDLAPRGRRIWITEAGSRVDTARTPDGRRLNDEQEQADEVQYLVGRLSTSRAAIARVYYYSLCAPSWLHSGPETFDAGLLGAFPEIPTQPPGGCAGQPTRAAYDTYQRYTLQNPNG